MNEPTHYHWKIVFSNQMMTSGIDQHQTTALLAIKNLADDNGLKYVEIYSCKQKDCEL